MKLDQIRLLEFLFKLGIIDGYQARMAKSNILEDRSSPMDYDKYGRDIPYEYLTTMCDPDRSTAGDLRRMITLLHELGIVGRIPAVVHISPTQSTSHGYFLRLEW